MRWRNWLEAEIERRKDWHRVFAWWPVVIDGQTVWLEWYWRRQAWSDSGGGGWCYPDRRTDECER